MNSKSPLNWITSLLSGVYLKHSNWYSQYFQSTHINNSDISHVYKTFQYFDTNIQINWFQTLNVDHEEPNMKISNNQTVSPVFDLRSVYSKCFTTCVDFKLDLPIPLLWFDWIKVFQIRSCINNHWCILIISWEGKWFKFWHSSLLTMLMCQYIWRPIFKLWKNIQIFISCNVKYCYVVCSML